MIVGEYTPWETHVPVLREAALTCVANVTEVSLLPEAVDENCSTAKETVQPLRTLPVPFFRRIPMYTLLLAQGSPPKDRSELLLADPMLSRPIWASGGGALRFEPLELFSDRYPRKL